MTSTNIPSFYPKMPNSNDRTFYDEQIQRFDANTIKNRYGDNWKNFASNVREITQPDGSIVKEYLIEDSNLLEEMKTSSRPSVGFPSSTITSDDEQQQLKNKFAQIKAKFEQKNTSNVMATPSTSSVYSHNSVSARQNSRKQMDDLYARHRRSSNESIPINRINSNENNSIGTSNQSFEKQHSYHRSQSIGSDRSKISSLRRFDSNDEADEEVSQIHKQGEKLRRHNQGINSKLSSNDISQNSRIQYEVVDEDGNPMALNDVQNLIKMSGVRAREVAQPDGSIIKEYVIDDPQVLSQFRSQQQEQQAPMTSSYYQQRTTDDDAPPPPPRVPLRPPTLFRPPGNDNIPYNIQQIHVLEPQRRYEYLTKNGQRIQFFITNSNDFNGQLITDSDVRELTNAINNRLMPSSSSTMQQPQHQQQQQPQYQQQRQQHQQPLTQMPFNLPKQWYPSVDLTHRQRRGSDTQPYSNNSNTNFHQMQQDLSRSASNGVLNQGSYLSQNQQQQQQVFHQPNNGWNTVRYHDPHNQHQQNNETIQTSAQFLPQQQQRTRSTVSPPINNNHPSISYQQSTAYPYQGQQQHGVRILNDFNPQQIPVMADGYTRI